MKKIILFLVLLFTIIPTSHAEDIHKGEISRTPEIYPPNEVQLFSTEKDLEERLIEAWSNLDFIISVKDLNIPTSQIDSLIERIFYRNPIYYYVTTDYFYTTKNGYADTIYPDYSEYDMTIIKEKLDAINYETELLLMNIDEDMTDFEKIMAVHDYMVLNYEYDISDTIDDISIMTEKKGVCMAYSLTFNYIMNLLDIDSVYVSSGDMDHSWNLVYLNGNWYHIDVTWDDPTKDKYGQVRHTFALLSTDEITHLSDDHYGFNLNGLAADSTYYDHAPWRNSYGSVVRTKGCDYWISGNDLVCDNGEIIFSNLDGGDNKWMTGSGSSFPGKCYAGLIVYEDAIYFNSEDAIYSYNPITRALTKLKSVPGVSGLLLHDNDLFYNKYDTATNRFVQAGKIHLGETRVTTRVDKNNKLVVSIYKESDDPITVYCYDGTDYQLKVINKKGFSSVTFDYVPEEKLFVWDSNMKPIKPKKSVIKHR